MSKKVNPIDQCVKYIKDHKRAKPATLIKNLGVSRATAYKAFRIVKEEGGEPAAKEEKKVVKAVLKDKKQKIKRKPPEFTIEGFHFKESGEDVVGKLLWSDIIYIGLCPVCTKKVALYKCAIMFSDSGKREVSQDYRGKCKDCDVNITIHRSRQ